MWQNSPVWCRPCTAWPLNRISERHFKFLTVVCLKQHLKRESPFRKVNETKNHQWLWLWFSLQLQEKLPCLAFGILGPVYGGRVLRLEGLTHNPPLHATHLTRAWVIFWAAAKHNRQNGWIKKLFSYYFSFLHRHGLVLWDSETHPLHWSLQMDCHSVQQITLANDNYEKTHLAPPCFRGLSHRGKPG